MKRLTLFAVSLFAAAAFAADVPISALPAATVVNSTDIVPIVQGGVTKKASVSLFPTGSSGGSTINILDEGVPISTAADTIDFTGAGVQCTGGGSSTKVCNITGASAGDAGADGSTKGISTFTATDFNAATGVISIDYTNGQASGASAKGFLTAADWATFNAKQAGHANLSGISSVVFTNDDIIQWKAGVPSARTPTQFLADLMALPTLVNNDATTARTLSSADNGRVVRFSSASPVAVTVPTGFSGFSTRVCRDGSGAVTLAGSATTLNGGPLVLTSQHQCADITAAGSNTFNVAGPRLKKSGTPTANQQAYFVDGDNVAGISVTPSSVQCTNGSGLPVACTNLTDSSVLATYAGINPPANTQSLLAAANYSAMRTLLSLVPGTNVQAYDADLGTWAGVTRASGFDTFAATPTLANFNAMSSDDILATGTLTDDRLCIYDATGGAGSTPAIVCNTTASGTGDVVGPASAVDNALVRFDGTGGKTIQDYTSNAPTCSDSGVCTFVAPVIGAATATTASANDNDTSVATTAYVQTELTAYASDSATFTNKDLSTSNTVSAALAWSDGVKQTFNPNGTNAGINVGSQAGDPSTPANGDLWYDSTANELTARINGANVALGAGGGGSGGYTSYVWASKPGSPTTGDTIKISDIGVGGSLWSYNGTYWVPVGGSVTLCAMGATTDITTTSDTLEWSCLIPAGVLQDYGVLELKTYATKSAATDQCWIAARMAAANDATGLKLWETAELSSGFDVYRGGERFKRLTSTSMSHMGNFDAGVPFGSAADPGSTQTVDSMDSAIYFKITGALSNAATTCTIRDAELSYRAY